MSTIQKSYLHKIAAKHFFWSQSATKIPQNILARSVLYTFSMVIKTQGENHMKHLVLALLTCLSFSANAQWNGGGWGGGNGRGEEWQQVDEVHFRDGKTAIAIANCKAARQVDVRCTRSRDYSCGACSEISHSDHSSYLVYQLVRGGRPGPGPGPRPPSMDRQFEQSFHFTDKQTYVAYQKCVNYRAALRQCQSPRDYECTPCTQESHTDHSQFDLYRLVRRW
jgi:hypothetical protein